MRNIIYIFTSLTNFTCKKYKLLQVDSSLKLWWNNNARLLHEKLHQLYNTATTKKKIYLHSMPRAMRQKRNRLLENQKRIHHQHKIALLIDMHVLFPVIQNTF